MGDRVGLGTALANLGATARARGEPSWAEAYFREALGTQREIGELEGIVYTLNGLAGVALDRGRTERAARLLGAAAALADATGVVVEPIDREQVEQDTAAARDRLGEGAFAAAWEAGRALALGAALAEAVAADDAGAALPPSRPESTRPVATHGLTERELDVLRLLVAGRTDREIAEALFIGLRTAQGHVANILAKLGVGSRTAAATAAIAAGIVASVADHPA